MDTLLNMVITVICAVAASSGFWAFLQHMRDKKDASRDLLLGLGHDRIISLCQRYIELGNITDTEYENLHKYLYLPYRARGGNGTAEKLMNEVEKLPVVKERSVNRYDI